MYLLASHQKMLQDVDDAHTVSVFVAFLSQTVVGGSLHVTAILGGNVVVMRSQQEQSLLHVMVWAGSVTVHRHGSEVVTVLVHATMPCLFLFDFWPPA